MNTHSDFILKICLFIKYSHFNFFPHTECFLITYWRNIYLFIWWLRIQHLISSQQHIALPMTKPSTLKLIWLSLATALFAGALGVYLSYNDTLDVGHRMWPFWTGNPGSTLPSHSLLGAYQSDPIQVFSLFCIVIFYSFVNIMNIILIQLVL